MSRDECLRIPTSLIHLYFSMNVRRQDLDDVWSCLARDELVEVVDLLQYTLDRYELFLCSWKDDLVLY